MTEEPQLRLLILDNEFPPLGGGTGVINYHLMQEFDALGIACDLVTSSRTCRSYERESFGAHGRIFKVPVDNRNIHHSTNIELLRYAWRGFFQSRRLLRQQPYDVCLAFAGVPAGGIALALRLFYRLPYVLSLQGPDVPWYERRYQRVYQVLLPVIKLIWHYAAIVTAQSTENKNLALRTMPHLSIHIIPNGVDMQLFSPSIDRRRGSQVPLTLICVGRLIERKGQQHLLQAIGMLQQRGYAGQVRVIFVGTGDAESELRTESEALGLQAIVTFAGFHPREDMPAFYNQADLFVLPSYNEGMSIALLEAMSASLPVIVTDTGGTAELVRDNGRIVPWARPDVLADSIEEFLCQPDRCAALGERSRAIAQEFDWKTAALRHVRLFEQVSRHAS
jgi:phosphatidylinositol alpha-1,6-mannosyltransferase